MISIDTANAYAYHREAPDLDVKTTAQEFLPVERLRSRIATILVDTLDDESRFALVEEVPGCVGLVRKVDESPVPNNAQEASQSSFNNEDPSKRLSAII
jgi:hypothetical protein